MTTLDSPLEALAFQYASLGVLAVVNNVWTWIAVVTAALSFWRIRLTITMVDDTCNLLEDITASKDDHLKPQETARAVHETAAFPVHETAVTKKKVREPLVCEDGVTKGKVTMYYEVDVDGGRCGDEEGELTAVNYEVDVDGGRCGDGEGELTDVNYGCEFGNNGEWWERWEKVVKMRNGDDEWYRYVDLTVLNGSVVRLWDDKRNL